MLVPLLSNVEKQVLECFRNNAEEFVEGNDSANKTG